MTGTYWWQTRDFGNHNDEDLSIPNKHFFTLCVGEGKSSGEYENHQKLMKYHHYIIKDIFQCCLPIMLTTNVNFQFWLPILTTNLTTNLDYQCWLPKRSLQRSMEGKGRVSMNHMKVLQNNQRIDAAVNRHSFNCVLPFKRNNCQILQKSLQFISKSSKNHCKHAFFTVVSLRWSIYAYKQVLQGIRKSSEHHRK